MAHAGPLDDMVPFAERENRMVIAYSPLAQGLLGGKYSVDNRPGGVRMLNPLFGRENLQRAAPLLDTLRQVAASFDAKPAQVALAWLLSLPRVVVIPGASSVEQRECNVAAAELELNADSRAALTAAARAFTPLSAARSLLSEMRGRFGVETARSQLVLAWHLHRSWAFLRSGGVPAMAARHGLDVEQVKGVSGGNIGLHLLRRLTA